MERAHLCLVRRIARQTRRRMPANVEYDDLVQEGTIGLMQALERFDANGGASFDTFASHRIRGAILDYLRREDYLSRKQRAGGLDADFSFVDSDALHAIHSDDTPPEDIADRHERLDLFARWLERRSDTERLVVGNVLKGELLSTAATALGVSGARVTQILDEALHAWSIWVGDLSPGTKNGSRAAKSRQQARAASRRHAAPAEPPAS